MTRSASPKAAAGIVLGVLVVAAGGALLFAQRGRGHASAPNAPPSTKAPLAGASAELLGLLDKGRHATFHARYSATVPSGTSAVPAVVEAWRRPPLARQDATISTGAKTLHTETLSLPTGSVSCVQQDSGPQTCQPIAGRVVPGPDQMIDAVAGRLSGASVTVRDDIIAAHPARCFHVALDQSTDICTDRDGVLLLIASGGARMELRHLDRDVGDVFVPPAPTVPATTGGPSG